MRGVRDWPKWRIRCQPLPRPEPTRRHSNLSLVPNCPVSSAGRDLHAEVPELVRLCRRQWPEERDTNPWNQRHSWAGYCSNVGDDNHYRVVDVVRNHESDRVVPVVEGRRDLATDSFVQVRISPACLHSYCGGPVRRVHPPPTPTPLGARAKSKAPGTEHSRRTSRLPQIDLAIADETNSGRTSEPAEPAQCRPNRSGLSCRRRHSYPLPWLT